MRKSRFAEAQILASLGEGEAGMPVADVCRKNDISTACYYQRKSKCAGLSANELKKVKELEAENARLKRAYAVLALQNAATKYLLARNFGADCQARCRADHVRGALPVARAGLQSSGATVIGAVQAYKGSGCGGRACDLGTQRGRREAASLGVLEVLRRLRTDGHGRNHKRICRGYCSMRLNLERKAKSRLMTRERQPLMARQELNRVWALEFMRDTLHDGRQFRTLNVIAERNREVLRMGCGTSIPAARLVRVMNQLVEVYGKPQAIRLDNGSELSAPIRSSTGPRRTASSCYSSSPASPSKNAFVECSVSHHAGVLALPLAVAGCVGAVFAAHRACL